MSALAGALHIMNVGKNGAA